MKKRAEVRDASAQQKELMIHEPSDDQLFRDRRPLHKARDAPEHQVNDEPVASAANWTLQTPVVGAQISRRPDGFRHQHVAEMVWTVKRRASDKGCLCSIFVIC